MLTKYMPSAKSIRLPIVATACLFGLFANVVPAAADEVGRIELNGRQVILQDDFTWAYGSNAAKVAENCTTVSSEVVPVSVCLDPNKWTFANLGGNAEHKLGLKGKELYLLIITEKQVLPISTLKKAAITNAQNASGLTKVETLSESAALIDGHGFGQIDYATTVDGVKITYGNYHSSFEGKGSVQLVFFAAQGEYDGFKSEIAEAIAGVKIVK